MSKLPEHINQLVDVFASEAIKELNKFAAKKSSKDLDPKAAVRSRGKCVFPAEHPKVTDEKDHFPINDAGQARNALSRANQYSSAPEWWKGSLQELVNAVHRAVKKHYKDIDVTKASKKPGKG
jgi:hypothetical protein